MTDKGVLTPAQAVGAARQALADQREEDAVDAVGRSAAIQRDDAVLWQWSALLHRALDDRERAIAAYRMAARLAPDDVKIAHGLARTSWEAGLPSLDLYAHALTFAPFDGDILLGHAAAQVAAGDRDGALAGIERVLAQEPRWLDGQRQAAHLRFVAGQAEAFTAGLEQALLRHPRDEGLWQLLLALVQQADDRDVVSSVAARARSMLGDRPFITAALAVIASETGKHDVADRAFATLVPLRDAGVAVHHVRHLLRAGRLDRASALLDTWLGQFGASAFYPYAALAWRLADDPRLDWLERDGTLVRTFDLSNELPPLDRLAATLRRLHHDGGDPLDQSVRGGSQTDGILLAGIDADIRQTRRAIIRAVERYVSDLPPVDLRHPTLAHRRDKRPRFSGSWSVRLRAGGRHANHIHPAGWISSALYVALPATEANDAAKAGWLEMGQPPSDLGLDLPARAAIEPQPGMLALFPSTMWHGTRPFVSGERLTIAFDIAPPLPR